MKTEQDNQELLDKFPHPDFSEAVLAPLFEGVKRHYVDPMNAINQAHLVMLLDTGILPANTCAAIAAALVEIDNDIDLDSLRYTGEHEDYFFLVEHELKRRTGPDTGGMLHTARSRNDMDHTIFKMVLKQKVNHLLAQLIGCTEVLLAKARSNTDTLIVAYTHGQPAQPSTYGHYLAAVIEVLLRDIQRLQQASEALDYCPMGAAAITTSGFPVDRQQMAGLLGFREPLLNSYGCIASVDYITGLYSAIKLIFLHLGRVIQDFQFWTAFEVGQLWVPNSLVQISSIMPQKRNPVSVEHLRHLSSVICGRCDTLVNTMHNTPFTDMNDSEGEVQVAGYAVFDGADRVLKLFSSLASCSSINAQRVAETIDRSCITITELADSLVREEKLSFRQAHSIAADTSVSISRQGRVLSEGYEFFSQVFQTTLGRATSLSEGDFKRYVSAENFVAVRNRPGGPAAASLADAMTDYAGKLEGFKTSLATDVARSNDAASQLSARFEAVAATNVPGTN